MNTAFSNAGDLDIGAGGRAVAGSNPVSPTFESPAHRGVFAFSGLFRTTHGGQFGGQCAPGVVGPLIRLSGMHEQLPLTPQHRRSRPPSGSEPLLEAADVAGWLGVTVAWVYAETRAGRLPHIAVGRFYRYRRTSIERWLQEHETS
ncbi:MAG: DNA-binding protein [Conexibacter sp.]|nr:DNA-binding protein [Conexibacter sp.]